MERREEIYLADDIVIRILSRLPVKSLMRFRSVSKSWDDFVMKDSTFMAMHLNNYTRSTNNNDNDSSIVHLVCGPIYDKVTDARTQSFSLVSFDKHNLKDTGVSSLQFDPSPILICECLVISGCCDGIVCLYDCMTPDRIGLWNPALRQFRILPESHIPLPPDHEAVEVHVGLGFDSVSNDYKVVQIVRHSHKDICQFSKYQVMIYSLKTDGWRKVDVNLPPLTKITTYSAWSLAWKNNTMICWWAVVKDGINRGDCQYHDGVILSFDLSSQVFLTTPVPSSYRDSSKDRRTRNIVPFDHSFALMAYTLPSLDSDTNFLTHHQIWVMNEFGVDNSWTKLLTLDLCLQPLGFWKDGEFLHYSFSGPSGELVFHNHATGETKYLGIHGTWPILMNAIVYKESLVSVFQG